MATEEKKKRRVPVTRVKVKGPKGKTGFAVLYSDGSIRIDWVRLSYPHLKKPYAGDNDDGGKGEAKFGVVGLLIKKGNTEVKELLDDRVAELLKENKVKALAADKKFIRNGDESDKDGYEGNWTISAREVRRPPLRNRDNSVVEPEDAAEVFQPGFWGSILIRPWFQNNKFGKRVNAGLSSVQFLMKDETFGEGGITEEELDDTFESYDDDDDDDPDDRPARKRKPAEDDYDDEEEKPRKPKRRARDDDDDDDVDI